MTEQITLYTNDISPFSHSVEIALEEAGVSEQVIRCNVPLIAAGEDKPAWFAEEVNPLGKVPTIAYGPQASPSQPSKSTIKIFESSVLVEFIAELYPQAKLVPNNLIDRAKARSFAAASASAFMTAWRDALSNNDTKSLYTALDHVQALLADGTTYAIGDEFTIADIAIGPWLGRLEMLLENDFFGKFGKGGALKVLEAYKGPKYDIVREYSRRVQERPSVKKTYLEDVAVRYFSKKFTPK